MHSPLTPLGQSLHRTVDLLREQIARRAAQVSALVPLVLLLWARLGRLRARFERLVLLWERGQLPTRRPRAPRAPRVRAPRPKPELRLPTGNAWLLKRVPLAGAYSCHIESLLADADTAALVQAAPQAGRILRPLARMFGIPLPDYLKLPPRPRAPRKPRPRKPRAPRVDLSRAPPIAIRFIPPKDRRRLRRLGLRFKKGF